MTIGNEQIAHLFMVFQNFNARLTPPAFNAGRIKTMAPE